MFLWCYSYGLQCLLPLADVYLRGYFSTLYDNSVIFGGLYACFTVRINFIVFIEGCRGHRNVKFTENLAFLFPLLLLPTLASFRENTFSCLIEDTCLLIGMAIFGNLSYNFLTSQLILAPYICFYRVWPNLTIPPIWFSHSRSPPEFSSGI